MKTQERDPVSAATIPMTGASEQLTQLFAAHHRRILIAAYRITGSMADAEDVLQTVFMRVGRGEAMPATSAGSYLYRAAINGALDLLRKRRSDAREPLEAAADIASAGDSPDAEISRAELRTMLRRAIGELPPRAAEMFTMRYLEDLGNREIAALMGTSQAVVAVTLHQTRSRLKKRLIALERGE